VKTCACPPEHHPERTWAHIYLPLRQFVAAFQVPDQVILFDIRCSRCRDLVLVSAKDVRDAVA